MEAHATNFRLSYSSVLCYFHLIGFVSRCMHRIHWNSLNKVCSTKLFLFYFFPIFPCSSIPVSPLYRFTMHTIIRNSHNDEEEVEMFEVKKINNDRKKKKHRKNSNNIHWSRSLFANSRRVFCLHKVSQPHAHANVSVCECSRATSEARDVKTNKFKYNVRSERDWIIIDFFLCCFCDRLRVGAQVQLRTIDSAFSF